MNSVQDSPWVGMPMDHRRVVWVFALTLLVGASVVFWTAETLLARQYAAVVVVVSVVALALAIATGVAYRRNVLRSRVQRGPS